jgi:hypothetical protein
MGIVVPFAGHRHKRTSAGSRLAGARAASSTKRSAVKPTRLAVSVESSALHHSSGIRSRCHHFRAEARGAPIFDARSPGDFQSPMTARNELSDPDMESSLGHDVLNLKSILSYDCGACIGQNGRMQARTSKTAEEAAYIERTRRARSMKFHGQKPVYTFLGVDQGSYKHWETSRPMPREYVPKFCLITECSMEWLLTGEGDPPALPKPEDKPRARRGRKAA